MKKKLLLEQNLNTFKKGTRFDLENLDSQSINLLNRKIANSIKKHVLRYSLNFNNLTKEIDFFIAKSGEADNIVADLIQGVLLRMLESQQRFWNFSVMQYESGVKWFSQDYIMLYRFIGAELRAELKLQKRISTNEIPHTAESFEHIRIEKTAIELLRELIADYIESQASSRTDAEKLKRFLTLYFVKRLQGETVTRAAAGESVGWCRGYAVKIVYNFKHWLATTKPDFMLNIQHKKYKKYL